MIDRVLLLSLGGCAIFAALLYVEFATTDGAQPAIATARAPAAASTPEPVRLPQPRNEALVATSLDRPLFSATRRPPETVPTDHSAAGQEALQFRLAGIIIAPGRHLAIFAAPGAKPLVRAESETIDGWRVDKIAPREVSLSGPRGSTMLVPKTDPSIVRTAVPTAQPAAPPLRPAAASAQPAVSGRPTRPVVIGRAPEPALVSPFRPPTGPAGPAPGLVPPRPPQ